MTEDFEVGLRAAVATDAAALLQLGAQLQDESAFVVIDANGHPPTVAEEAEAITQLNSSGTNLIVVATVAEKLVGLVTITETDPQRGELGIAVLSAYQGLGLGTALMDVAVEWLQTQSHLNHLWLTVNVHNQRAVRLYHRQGFHVTQTDHDLLTMEH
ncbi:GNAT family N-acetyltransferase [Fructilactobacillus myrtifloralis]|uniref:GNAT family N-acetyltransferase n=1 Tax=Fructilactobacillus myrtifloralis TaxID=2940301 RepID=A0ABY5BNA8_9LACO|nr:GNAT family N-acetyltransferase [Fructilactobacillus myrtifloralis]USS84979.1 GNAT family N-acetyltransferase [Fructilactobacillus myrtifloralis]